MGRAYARAGGSDYDQEQSRAAGHSHGHNQHDREQANQITLHHATSFVHNPLQNRTFGRGKNLA